MKGTKTHYLFSCMVKFLDGEIIKIRFCRMRNYKGLAGDASILIDHTSNILEVFVHEVLHLLHPEWTESKVLKETRWFITYSTWYQKRELLDIMLFMEKES